MISSDSGLHVAVLKSWDFSEWQTRYGGGQLPYRMDQLESRGITLHWTDRTHSQLWAENRALWPVRQLEKATVPFSQTALLSRRIRRCDATIAMFESEGNFLAAVRNVVPARRRRPFLLISCWLAELLSHSRRRRRLAYRNLYRSVDVLYYLSRNQGPLLEEMLGLPPERLRYLPFGVDTESFAPGGTPDGGYVLAVGRDRGRDWPTFFQAVEGLDVRVKVCCRLSDIAGIRVPGNVEILGYVGRDRYRDLLGRAAVVAVLTRPLEYPSGQSVLLEAMAMGRTVVVTRTPALSEYVSDGDTCLAVPPKDPAAARLQIETALGDADLRAQIGQAARFRVDNEFSSRSMWNVVADDLFRLTGRTP